MNKKEMMQPDEGESIYGDVTKRLKQLKRVNAPDNFEDNLFRKINSAENLTVKNEPIKIFVRKKLVPSLAVAAVAIIVIFMIKTQPVQSEDPFSIKPRIREDVIASGENMNKSVEDYVRKGFKENSTDQKPAEKLETQSDLENNLTQSAKSSPYKKSDAQLKDQIMENSNDAILQGYSDLSKADIKNGLNYKQVYLDKAQRKELTILKEKMEKMYFENKR